MNNFEDIFGDYFDAYIDAYKSTQKYKDDFKMEIMLRRQEFEKNLDDMWSNYSKGMVMQLVNYNKQLDSIKSSGLKVLRSSSGKHKIVVPK